MATNGFRGPLPPLPSGVPLVGQAMTLKGWSVNWVYECSCGETLLFTGNIGVAGVCRKCRQFVKIEGFATTETQQLQVAARIGRVSQPHDETSPIADADH